MEQVGYTGTPTGPKTEEPHNGDRLPEGQADESGASPAVSSLSVYRAGPGAKPIVTEATEATIADLPCPASNGAYPDGFTGTLALQNLEAFDEQTVGDALDRVAHLIAWAQAQQARLLNRMEILFRDTYAAPAGRVEPGMAFTLAASECATILNVPQVTGQRLLSEAGRLCGTHANTLKALEDGRFSYPHAQVVLDQSESVPAADLPEFEADLLQRAKGQTRAQFSCKARRLRETKYPQTIPERHRSAFEQRKVTLEREEDGMSWLSVLMRAAEAQQIYTALSTAARGEQADGDPRTRDQLRADILAQLLMGSLSGSVATGPRGAGICEDDDEGQGGAGILPRAEIMVLINAETLFGADEQPAELHGYGPISADEARRLARNAVHWTGLAQNPHTGEILGVGRRRKVPAGLARWLRARDGTCRFPGCRVSTAVSEIDHTTDWAKGGPTDHGNLAHLCRRHHRFKTLGFWKACQPSPGVMEWTSPSGRLYRTEPYLEVAPAHPDPERPAQPPPF